MDLNRLLTIALIAGVLLGVIVIYMWLQKQNKIRIPRFWERKKDSPDANISLGSSSAADANSTRPSERTSGKLAWNPRTIGGAIVLVVLLVAAGWWLTDPLNRSSLLNPRSLLMRLQSDQFIVLVAPFDDGSDGQTGRNVAHELVREIEAQGKGRLRVELLNTPPANDAVARAKMAEYAADVLVLGNVQAGALLDEPSLMPRLMYLPSGAFAPHVWIGYDGRFTMPEQFVLAKRPVNGKVVVPHLLLALDDYSQGKDDLAFAAFEQLLLDDVNVVNGSLLRSLRGNMLWARNDYAVAIEEYRRAVEQAEDQTEQALLTNNLGAILLDAGDLTGAADAFTRSFQLLGHDNLGALHLNLGLLAQQQGRRWDALGEFELAQQHLPPIATVQLLLTNVYREHGQLHAAATALDEADRQIRSAVQGVPSDLRGLFDQQLVTELREQTALLELAKSVKSRGPLAWELEISPPRPSGDLSSPIRFLRDTVHGSEQLIKAWRSHAAAQAAARTMEEQATDLKVGLIDAAQVQKLERALDRYRYDLALALIEQERSFAAHPRGILGDLPLGILNASTARSESEQMLSDVLGVMPTNVDARIAYARASWLRFNAVETAARYQEIVDEAPQRPEGYYGQGRLALQQGDRDTARQLMQQALNSDPTYFPARLTLIQMADQAGDSQTVLAEARILSEQYPGLKTGLGLAAALRRTGAAGFEEAHQILLTLRSANAILKENNSPVLTELGRLYRDNHQTAEAIRYYEEARIADKNAIDPAIELGQILAANDQAEKAATQFRAVLANDAENIAARLTLADLYDGPLNEPNLADEQYRRVIELQRDQEEPPYAVDAERWVIIGDALLRHREDELAAEAFQLALVQQPITPAIHHRLGQTYLRLKDVPRARDAEQRALDLTGPDDTQVRAGALAGLGDVARLEQRFDDALSLYNDALTLNPGQVEAKVGLGQVAVAQNNWEVAFGHFKQATEFPEGQNDPMAHFWYAEALLRQGKADVAKEHYTIALNARADFAEAWLGLAEAHQGQRDLRAAEQAVDKALEIRRKYAEALLFRGKLLQSQNRMAAALDSYSDAIDANNQLPEPYYRRGLIYLEEQNLSGAVRDLYRASVFQPDNGEIQYWLGRAYFAQNRFPEALASFQRAVALGYSDASYYQTLVEQEIGRREASTVR